MTLTTEHIARIALRIIYWAKTGWPSTAETVIALQEICPEASVDELIDAINAVSQVLEERAAELNLYVVRQPEGGTA